MRVIAGEQKGRKLFVPKGRIVRPTADRVREAIFAILFDVRGAHVLDLYAGSGALGIEALSRGAAEATFIDTSSHIAIQKNLDRLNLSERGHVHRQRCEQFLVEAAKKEERWDLFFVDPPYRLAGCLAETLESLLRPVIEEGARIVVESSYNNPIAFGFPQAESRRFGDTLVNIYKVGKTGNQ